MKKRDRRHVKRQRKEKCRNLLNWLEKEKAGLIVGFLCGIAFALLMVNILQSFRTSEDIFAKVSGTETQAETETEIEIETETEVEIETETETEEVIAEHMIDNPASDADRNTNLKIVAEKINGRTIYPGQKFSYMEDIGNPTLEDGYKMAGEMAKGKGTEGVGGGICQAFCTLNSAMQKTDQCLDSQVYHAEKHSGTVKYLNPDRGDKEATVAFSSGRDFWFISTLYYPIRFQAWTEADKVYVRIIGIKTIKVKKMVKKKIKKIQKIPIHN